jgi:hypothetical protein
MDKNKLKLLKILEAEIECLEKERAEVNQYLIMLKNTNLTFTFAISTVEDVKQPYIHTSVIKDLLKNVTDLNFNNEVKVFLTLVLDKMDEKLSELKEQFENG